jgi:hypothetical protein
LLLSSSVVVLLILFVIILLDLDLGDDVDMIGGAGALLL